MQVFKLHGAFGVTVMEKMKLGWFSETTAPFHFSKENKKNPSV